MDNLKNFRRTNYCGDLRLGDTGKTASLCGWVQRQRDPVSYTHLDVYKRQTLKSYLPQESYTDNGRFSPADRYQEIWDALY